MEDTGQTWTDVDKLSEMDTNIKTKTWVVFSIKNSQCEDFMQRKHLK